MWEWFDKFGWCVDFCQWWCIKLSRRQSRCMLWSPTEKVPEGQEWVKSVYNDGEELKTGVRTTIYLRESLQSLRWLIPKVAQPHHQRQYPPIYPANTYLHPAPTPKPPTSTPICVVEMVTHPYRIGPSKPVIWMPVWMPRDTPAHFSQHTDSETCNTFATVAFHSHHLMPMWTVFSCLWYPSTQFLSIVSH